MQRLLFIGHSHITALAQAWAQAPLPGLDAAFLLLNDPLFEPVMTPAGLNPAILARLGGAALYVSLLGGNDHSILSMLNHPRRFDVVLPEAPDLPLDPEAEILPAGLVRAALAARVRPHLAALAALRAAVAAPVWHQESPPPVPSAAHIEAYPGVFRDEMSARGVAPALLRWKMWRLHSALYREECARLGVSFCPAPARMQDAQGCMRPEAWNPDPTHGNPLYGQAVLAGLAELLVAA